MTSKLPEEKDWGNYFDDLDVADSYKMFFGKSNDEMQKEFKKNIFERCFDLEYMPLIPFQYYIFGLKQYIDTGNIDQFDKPDTANCFIELVEDKLKKQPEYIRPILMKLMPTIEYVVNNQILFEADIDIYGDFNEKLKIIKQLAEEL